MWNECHVSPRMSSRMKFIEKYHISLCGHLIRPGKYAGVILEVI